MFRALTYTLIACIIVVMFNGCSPRVTVAEGSDKYTPDNIRTLCVEGVEYFYSEWYRSGYVVKYDSETLQPKRCI